MPVLNFGQPDEGVIQMAFITDDLQRAMRDMSACLGVGPWFHFEEFELCELRYMDEPADFRIGLALANSGHMQFELIQPLDDKPSPYRRTRERRGWGFHHYAVAARDFDGTCARLGGQGYRRLVECSVPVGARAAYYDTDDALAGMIEVVEMTPEVETLWTTIHHASVGWDGEDPVRSMT
ncbi:VOC family protein [Parahaliea mediterranea]|uniref:VOC family protein n=1 Tax=Parahaliea mediterranea TaxID=651086 RepID=A0A939DFK9_9GAMM|nr:VOC family protein [Parahaliea mediterranea]MBN7796627.1 VOC family protein [Parahaliea mediterranea]